MSSTVENISPVVQELAITIPADEIKKAANSMFARVRKTAKVNGFRKGKMPMAIAKKMFAQSVYAELTSDLTYRSFLEALKEHELSPIGEPQFMDMSALAAEGSDYSFKVKVETAPRLEEIVTEGIVLKRNKVVVNKEFTEKELKRLQNSLATTKELARKRAAKLGDAVKLELRRKNENGEWSEDALPQELALEDEQCPQELLDELPGMKLEEEKEVVFGKDRDNPMEFLIKLVELKQRVLPKLDDDFAKDLGDFETLDDLKSDIEKRYITAEEKREKDSLKQSLIDSLRERNAMTLPPTILEKQTEAMRGQYENIVNQVAAAKIDAKDDGSEETEKGEAQMDDSAQKAAAEIVHTHFLIDEIARIGDLKVTPEDIEAQFKEMSESSGLPVARLKADYSERKYASELESRILEDKVFDFILPKVTIEEVKPTAKKKTVAKSKTAEKKKPAAKKKPATKKKAAEKTEDKA